MIINQSQYFIDGVPTLQPKKISEFTSTNLRAGPCTIYNGTIYFFCIANIDSNHYGNPCLMYSSDGGETFTLEYISTTTQCYAQNTGTSIEANSNYIMVLYYERPSSGYDYIIRLAYTVNSNTHSWNFTQVETAPYGNPVILGFATNGNQTVAVRLDRGSAVYCTTNLSTWTGYDLYSPSYSATPAGQHTIIYNASNDTFYTIWKYSGYNEYYVAYCSASAITAAHWRQHFTFITNYNTLSGISLWCNGNGLALAITGSSSTSTPYGWWIDLINYRYKAITSPSPIYWNYHGEGGYYNGTWIIAKATDWYYSTATTYSDAGAFTSLGTIPLTDTYGYAYPHMIFKYATDCYVFGTNLYYGSGEGAMIKKYLIGPRLPGIPQILVH